MNNQTKLGSAVPPPPKGRGILHNIGDLVVIQKIRRCDLC